MHFALPASPNSGSVVPDTGSFEYRRRCLRSVAQRVCKNRSRSSEPAFCPRPPAYGRNFARPLIAPLAGQRQRDRTTGLSTCYTCNGFRGRISHWGCRARRLLETWCGIGWNYGWTQGDFVDGLTVYVRTRDNMNIAIFRETFTQTYLRLTSTEVASPRSATLAAPWLSEILQPAHVSVQAQRLLVTRTPARSSKVRARGEVAEWSNAPHSKCGIPARVSWVQIPPSPP